MASESFRESLTLGLYTESPLHCGAESGLGYVDLPVQRERHTAYPFIPGSTLKGRSKDETKTSLSPTDHVRIFGAMDTESDPPRTTPGSVSFGDGHLVAFPVRSLDRPFRWVTCPFAVERALRLLDGAPALDESVADGEALVHDTQPHELLLEELALTTRDRPDLFADGAPLARLLDLLPPEAAGYDYTRKIFQERLTLVSDASFKELVETGTDVLTRIKLTALGTTTDIPKGEHPEIEGDDRKGNLFVEEVVPAETLFVAALRLGEADDLDLLSQHLTGVFQIGGGETIGRGVTRLTPTSPATSPDSSPRTPDAQP